MTSLFNHIQIHSSSSGIRNSRIFENACLILTVSLCIAFLYFNIYANIDLALGRFVLDMDERTAFNGVQKILHPIDLENFLWSIRDGIDHRYGRIFWNSMAAVSYIPEKIFGESGQIIASRGLQVFLLFMAACFFSYFVVDTWYARFIIFLAIFTLPFSAYYQTNPKPEPIQLFFLSLYICYYLKNRMNFGWYWIFLGLAFGAKISTLPAVVIFFLASTLINYHSLSSGKTRSILNAMMWFACGFSLAVPIFLFPFVIVVGSYTALLALNAAIKNSYRKPVLFVAFLIFLEMMYRSGKTPLIRWFSNTFLSTTHGSDQASIDFLSWLNYFFGGWLNAPSYISVAFILIIFTPVLLTILNWIGKGKISKHMLVFLTVFLAGLALNFSIFISAQRLWGFYLFPGTVLLIISIVGICENGINFPQYSKNIILKTASILALSVICIFSTLFFLPQTIYQLEKAASRTNEKSYILELQSFNESQDFLLQFSQENHHRIRVMYTPSLFLPVSTDRYEIVDFSGPYQWGNEGDEVLVLGKNHTLNGANYPRDSVEYPPQMEERKGYQRFVANNGKACKESFCYKVVKILSNHAEILIKIK